MNTVCRLPLLLLCCAAFTAYAQAPKPAPATPAQTPVVGRLFFTPEQREQLDLLRLKKVVASQAKDEPPPEIITYEGIVRRADGQTTVWVNNKPLTERELRDAPAVAGRIERDGRLRLQAGQAGAGAALRLKVGQRAELSSGRIEERPATDIGNFIAKQRNSTTTLPEPEKRSVDSPSSSATELTSKTSKAGTTEKTGNFPQGSITLEELSKYGMTPEEALKLKAQKENFR